MSAFPDNSLATGCVTSLQVMPVLQALADMVLHDMLHEILYPFSARIFLQASSKFNATKTHRFQSHVCKPRPGSPGVKYTTQWSLRAKNRHVTKVK